MIPRKRRRYLRELELVRKKLACDIMNDLQIEDARDALTLLQKDDLSSDMKVKCLSVVGSFRISTALPEVIDVLRTEYDPIVTQAAADAIIGIASKRATKGLLRTLQSTEKSNVRFSCVYALWFLKDRRSLPTLQRILRSESVDSYTRSLAAEALGQFPRSLKFLLSFRDHRLPDIRIGVLCGVVAITENRAILDLFEDMLRDNAITSSGEVVSDLASRLLGHGT